MITTAALHHQFGHIRISVTVYNIICRYNDKNRFYILLDVTDRNVYNDNY